MTNQGVTRYVRFTDSTGTRYGIAEGDQIHELEGDLFENPRRTGRTVGRSAVRLEVPVDPDRVQKVLGLVLQFTEPRQKQKHPRLFGMFPTSLTANGTDIVNPPECTFLHHEGEMVVVIGRQVPRFTSVGDAPQYVFGVTVGNDVADSSWYSEQGGIETPTRLLAKCPDTWAPLGEEIVAGLNYDDLQLRAILNGTEVFRVRTSDMNNSVAEIVSYLSEYITLMPGDLIYMGTPNLPREQLELHAGDTIEIELEGVPLLRNRVVQMREPALVLPKVPADQPPFGPPPPQPAAPPRA